MFRIGAGLGGNNCCLSCQEPEEADRKLRLCVIDFSPIIDCNLQISSG